MFPANLKGTQMSTNETLFATKLVDNETGVTKTVAEIFEGTIPISDVRVERLIEGVSLATNQQPTTYRNRYS